MKIIKNIPLAFFVFGAIAFFAASLSVSAQESTMPAEMQNMQNSMHNTQNMMSMPQQFSVNANNGNFDPKELTVPVGAKVTWTNRGHDGHTVTSDTGLFDSGSLAQNATFNHTFDTAGLYQYYCKVDGAPGGVGMSGKITVVDYSAGQGQQGQENYNDAESQSNINSSDYDSLAACTDNLNYYSAEFGNSLGGFCY